MFEFVPIMCNAYCMVLLTIKFFQVCEMCATPYYICAVDIDASIRIVKN